MEWVESLGGGAGLTVRVRGWKMRTREILEGGRGQKLMPVPPFPVWGTSTDYFNFLSLVFLICDMGTIILILQYTKSGSPNSDTYSK